MAAALMNFSKRKLHMWNQEQIPDNFVDGISMFMASGHFNGILKQTWNSQYAVISRSDTQEVITNTAMPQTDGIRVRFPLLRISSFFLFFLHTKL